MKEMILKNKAALILAIFLGFLMIWPHLNFMIALGGDFKGILPSLVDDESFYNARIQEALDGYSTIGNAYLFEHKDSLSLQFFGEYLLAQPLKIFDFSVMQGRFLYNLLLPSLSFILTYLILFLITKSRFWSVIFSSFLFFGLYLNQFLRPVSPQFNFIFWLTQFLFLWQLIKNKSSRKFLFLNAVNFGLLFYIYPYYWTFYLVFLTILAGIYFVNDRELSFAVAKIIGGGVILAVPYFINSYFILQAPEYIETITRVGLIYSHFPSGIKVVSGALALLVFFVLALKSNLIKINSPTQFFMGGILAAVISINSHLLTGKNLEFSSHYRMLSIFFFVFSFAYLWKVYLERSFHYGAPRASPWHRFIRSSLAACPRGGIPPQKTHSAMAKAMVFWGCDKKIVGLALVSLVLFMAAQNTYAYLNKYSTSVSSESQEYAPLFDWLNKNTPKDSVVYANDILSNSIPIYTSNNVFYSENANLFLMADDEVLSRFVLNNFFEPFDEKFVIKNARAIYRVRHLDIYGHAVQGNKLRRLLGMQTTPEIYLPKDAIDNVLKYAGELKNSNLQKELGKYRIDYMLWDKNRNPEWQFDNQKFVSKIFENNDFVMYSVNFK